MGFTTTELEEFHRFANDELSGGSSSISLEECLHRWRVTQQEHGKSVAAIRESIADEQAGRVRPLTVIADEFRRERGYEA